MPDPATQPTHEPRTPHPEAVKRIARHLLGEDIVNIRAALESFPNGYTVVPKAAVAGDAARTLRAMLRAHRNLAPPCAIEEALLDRALAEAASPAALDVERLAEALRMLNVIEQEATRASDKGEWLNAPWTVSLIREIRTALNGEAAAATAPRPDPALDVSEAISLVLDGEDYEGAPYCAMETLGSDGPEEYGCACEEWTDLSGITWGQHVAEKVVARLSRSAGEQGR